jgi:putative heme-binding domain-containing protein
MKMRVCLAIVCCATTAFSFVGSRARSDDADDAAAAKDASIVEVLLRLENFNLDASPPAKQALLRYLDRNRGSEKYFKLVEKFSLSEEADQLARIALENPHDTKGVDAAKLLARIGELPRLQEKAKGEADSALAAVTVVGFIGTPEVLDWLASMIVDTKATVAVRIAAAEGLGRNRSGEQRLLELVESARLPADLNFSVANILYASRDDQIRQRVGQHLQLPATAKGDPLPPVSELVGRAGNPSAGREVFLKKGTCIKCHKVAGDGKEVGPDLSEIGSKLSKEALYVAILNPNAGISHNYETYELVTAGGQIASGILVSRTDQEVKLKNAEGIELTFPAGEVDELSKLEVSLMPANLQQNLSTDELTDLVEFLTTLKKKA